jgi:hypothetical protein
MSFVSWDGFDPQRQRPALSNPGAWCPRLSVTMSAGSAERSFKGDRGLISQPPSASSRATCPCHHRHPVSTCGRAQTSSLSAS